MEAWVYHEPKVVAVEKLHHATNADVSAARVNSKVPASALIIEAQGDVLQDQRLECAQHLKAAAVSKGHKLFEWVSHDFFGMGAVVAQALEAEQLAAAEHPAAFSK